MDNNKYHLGKRESPLFKELTLNRLKKNNKIIIAKYQNSDNNSMNIKSSVEKLKKIQKENNLTNYKNSILNHIRISENSQNLMGKSVNKNNIYDLGDLINNLKSIKSHSINIKQKNNLMTNINKTNRNIGIHSIDKLNKKSIEKDKDINNNDFYISSKTFNKNDLTLNDKISNHRNKILKKDSHDIARNIDNLDIDKLINKFKQYKLIKIYKILKQLILIN